MAIVSARLQPARDTAYDVFRDAFPDFIRQLHNLRRYRDRAFRTLVTLPGRDRHAMTRKLLFSRSLHLLYAYEGMRTAKRLRHSSPDDIRALALRCNPYQRSDEPPHVSWVAARGRHRPVANFGPLKRMHQLLVADLLRHLHPPREQQFLFRGGMPAAFRAVEDAHAEGFHYGAEVDLIDFYGSVRLEGLGDLLRPLPPSVVEHTVWDRSFRDDRDDDTVSTSSWPSPSLNGQIGLALGASSSPIVGERIIASLLASDDQCRTVAYADNILVLGRSPEAVVEYYGNMQEQASRRTGWTLRPRRDGVALLAEGFDFLHHSASLDGGRFVWAPDDRKLRDFLAAENDDDLSMNEIAEAEAKVSHWRRSYPDWPVGDLWETQQLAALAARRFYNSATPINRSQAAHALIASYFASGRIQRMEELAPSGKSPRDDNRRAELINAAAERLIVMARRARLGPEAIRPLD